MLEAQDVTQSTGLSQQGISPPNKFNHPLKARCPTASLTLHNASLLTCLEKASGRDFGSGLLWKV